MTEDRRPTRLQDFVQGGLILVLIVLLLLVGSIATGYMVRAELSENKAAVAKMEYDARLKTVEADLKLRIDRVQDTAQNDSFTKDRRIRLLEARLDEFEKEVVIHRKELEKLKH